MAEEPGPSTTRYRKLTEAQITSISGAVSGFTATVAKQPVQRLKWIRQVDAGPAVPYNQVLQRQLAADGFFGLFRGSTAAIARNVPHSALVYSFFPFFERHVSQQLYGGEGAETRGCGRATARERRATPRTIGEARGGGTGGDGCGHVSTGDTLAEPCGGAR